MLLRFEFINKKHSDRALSYILINILKSFKVRDRIFTIITDNISNNLTLLKSLNKSLGKFINNIFVKNIIRLTCFTHVIQLSVKVLLETINANP